MTSLGVEADRKVPPVPSQGEAARVWARIGVLSFGGPSAQIALMHRVIVDEKGWLTERQYLNALSFCMLLPGPEAMQLATYAGWRIHGAIGGLIAGLLFVLPGALVVLALAAIYALYGDVPLVAALFLGVKAAVLIIVLEALLRVSKRALLEPEHWLIAALAFVGLFFLALPYPLIVIAAAVFGFARGAAHVDGEETAAASADRSWTGTLRTVLVWLVIWWGPLIAVGLLSDHAILADLGIFFAKLAVVTFGGAYAVLAYMAPGRGGQVRLADGRRNDGRPGARRDHARTAHSRHRICRLSRRIPRRRHDPRPCWCRRHALDDLRALLSLDLWRAHPT